MRARNIMLLSILALLAVPLAGCSGLDKANMANWYRVEPLFTDKDGDGVSPIGQINPYKFRFPDQQAAGRQVSMAHSQSDDALAASMAMLAPDNSRQLALQTAIDAASRSATPQNQDLVAQLQGELVMTARAEVSESNRKSSSTAYDAAQKDKINRNRFIMLLVKQSDTMVSKHLSEIIGTQDTLELGFSTTSTATSAVASIISPVGTKNILSAISAISSGTRTAVREQVYTNAFAWAIVDAIRAERQEKLSTITTGMSQGVDQYSIDQALADIVTYHESGSFYNGVVAINRRVASGDRRGLRVESVPAVSLSFSPAEPTVAADGTADVKIKFEREAGDSRSYVITFEQVNAATLADTNTQAARATGDAKDHKFELLLTGEIAFKVTPVPLDPNQTPKKYKPILVSVNDAHNTRRVVAVK
ncbi:MAG: hypothetical protein U0637_06550 [Phycisphaerales bacterium]